ncbi:hypothetical protein SKAU_G00398060 [Synaphobranchus kaupii]|uniref:Uncharacterized protein n=1 Tax=Synaphobranchus kaupii TaxID=118154 RepID=A0A9Q1E8J1_SYNKA|nr:hypothetical protein SKAU_G00398060 [Synaphobranchus kaupii]
MRAAESSGGTVTRVHPSAGQADSSLVTTKGVAELLVRTSLATREPPRCPEVHLEQWKEVKRELRQELQDQLAALGRTLV